MKLTKKQTEQLTELKEHGPLFVGHKFTVIMRTLEILVSKGFVQIVDEDVVGKEYAAIASNKN